MRTTMMMAAVLMVMTGCATAGSSVKLHDPAATQEIEQFMRDGFDAMNKNDIAYWQRTACPEAVMWDMDENGKAIAAKGKAEVDAVLGGYQKMLDSGMKMSTTVTSIECRSSSVSGHCMVEFDQSMTTPDGKTMGPMKFRGTGVAEKLDSGKWIWSHWHASMREMPAAPEAAAPAAAGPAAAAPTAAAATATK